MLYMTEEKKKIAVALVEDDDEIRSMLEILIDRSPGFSCKLVFNNCEDAMEPLKKHLPDVVLMDVGLPGMNGWELAAWFKTVSKPPILIAITGSGQKEDYKRSEEAGIHFHLVKPVDVAIILDLLKGLVKTVARKK